ncbi:hypothetical protein HMPREF9057_02068 [Actinomyces sp. oral taxon 171 str. F0337]|nr:hypothetical protein HMPREF9057_02068 [Actinomyces sp. oral taxon 171 str. F0337]
MRARAALMMQVCGQIFRLGVIVSAIQGENGGSAVLGASKLR